MTLKQETHTAKEGANGVKESGAFLIKLANSRLGHIGGLFRQELWNRLQKASNEPCGRPHQGGSRLYERKKRQILIERD